MRELSRGWKVRPRPDATKGSQRPRSWANGYEGVIMSWEEFERYA